MLGIETCSTLGLLSLGLTGVLGADAASTFGCVAVSSSSDYRVRKLVLRVMAVEKSRCESTNVTNS